VVTFAMARMQGEGIQLTQLIKGDARRQVIERRRDNLVNGGRSVLSGKSLTLHGSETDV